MEHADIQIYAYYSNGKISEDVMTLPDVQALRERFELFVRGLSNATPAFTEFHCKVEERFPKNADSENPEEILVPADHTDNSENPETTGPEKDSETTNA